MKFVCFVGKDKVGKTTMSKALCDVLLKGYRKPILTISFSDALRDELVKLYGLPEKTIMDKSIDKTKTVFRLGDYNYNPIVPEMWVNAKQLKSISEFDNIVISLRDLFVTHGTKVCRTLDKDYWLRHFSAKVEQVKDHVDFIVCDDARNPDDFKYFKDKDTVIIHLDNGIDNGTNTEQENFLKWLSNNVTSVDKKLDVAVPLLSFTAEKLIKAEVVPLLIERKRSTRVYRDDIFGQLSEVS